MFVFCGKEPSTFLVSAQLTKRVKDAEAILVNDEKGERRCRCEDKDGLRSHLEQPRAEEAPFDALLISTMMTLLSKLADIYGTCMEPDHNVYDGENELHVFFSHFFSI